MLNKILITRPLPERVLNAARSLGDVTVREITDPMQDHEMITSLQDYDIILPTLRDMYTRDIFKSAGTLRTRLLANFGVGFNHIDIAAAHEHNIIVSNTPGAVTDATADIALSLMLMTTRRTAEGERLARSGTWSGWHPTQMLGMHMSGKTVGIVGMGRIGQAIAHRCHYGFGMEVKYFNRSSKRIDIPAKQIDTIAELAQQVDILVAAVPGGAETHHLFNKDIFQALGPRGFFINISRGEVVDEAALITALETGQIAGAGLDVYEHEPHIPKELRQMGQVVLLPHLGTASLEVREDMGLLAVHNIQDFLNGLPPRSQVSP